MKCFCFLYRTTKNKIILRITITTKATPTPIRNDNREKKFVFLDCLKSVVSSEIDVDTSPKSSIIKKGDVVDSLKYSKYLFVCFFFVILI